MLLLHSCLIHWTLAVNLFFIDIFSLGIPHVLELFMAHSMTLYVVDGFFTLS